MGILGAEPSFSSDAFYVLVLKENHCEHEAFTCMGLSECLGVLLDAPSIIAGAPSFLSEWAKMPFT